MIGDNHFPLSDKLPNGSRVQNVQVFVLLLIGGLSAILHSVEQTQKKWPEKGFLRPQVHYRLSGSDVAHHIESGHQTVLDLFTSSGKLRCVSNEVKRSSSVGVTVAIVFSVDGPDPQSQPSIANPCDIPKRSLQGLPCRCHFTCTFFAYSLPPSSHG